MKRRKSGGAYRKERMILTASGILVLTAMTVTGVYLYQSNQATEQEGNVVDFSVLENSAQEKSGQVAQAQNSSAQNLTSTQNLSDEENLAGAQNLTGVQDSSGELDYDPYYVEQERLLNEAEKALDEGNAQTAGVGPDAAQITEDGLEAQEEAEEGGNQIGYAKISAEGIVDTEVVNQESADAESVETDEAGQNVTEDAQEAVADVMQEEINLHFSEEEKLQWPIVGNVLLNYSMDSTIYFQTLQQYKYNPSIVISATQGTSVACAADGVVESIYTDPQTGTTVVMNLGDGYALSYGQLQDLTVEEGDFVETGAFIGKVAAPTKYYTVEGTNVYFKLTKDGEPVNPLNYLG